VPRWASGVDDLIGSGAAQERIVPATIIDGSASALNGTLEPQRQHQAGRQIMAHAGVLQSAEIQIRLS
jgi:hypothetical protein